MEVKSIKHLFLRSVTGPLRVQLMLTTVVPVTALLIALSAVGFFGLNRLTRTLVEERDSELVQLAAQQVAGHWADSVLLLTQVASSETVRNGTPESIQATLTASMPVYQRFDEVSITGPTGIVIATEGGRLGDSMGEHVFFDHARRLRRPVRSGVFQNARATPVVAVAVPIYDLYGQFAGCAMGIWNLNGNRLGMPVAGVRVGENGFAYLVNDEGIVLYHPEKGYVGADLQGHPAVAALLQGEIGAQTIKTSNITTVVGYAPIPLREFTSSLFADDSWAGWGLVTSEAWDDIVAPLQPYVRLVGVLLFGAIIFPLTILAVNSQRIVAPLQSLVEQAERVASGEFDTQVSIARGPTEVQELELAFNAMVDQLRRYRHDIQNYVVSILNSQEQERKRIARELHDDTAQALVVLGRRIDMAQEMAVSKELQAELEALRNLVDDTLESVRRFTSDLRPPLLEELGLPRTLELLGDRTEREESFTVEVCVEGEPIQLLPELDLALYRLTQESLNNVRRHARADHVVIRLAYDSDAVTLEVRDDGIGFQVPSTTSDLLTSGRLGLMGIYERARLFGGGASIQSELGRGTAVTVSIPLSTIVLPRTEEAAVSSEPGGLGIIADRSW